MYIISLCICNKKIIRHLQLPVTTEAPKGYFEKNKAAVFFIYIFFNSLYGFF